MRPRRGRPSPGPGGAVVAALVMVALVVAAAVGAVTGDGERGTPTESSCVRWYPDQCVPADQGALDCDEVQRTPLRVEGADPFDFDGDLDGTGCEAG
jgi:hypothetical protein